MRLHLITWVLVLATLGVLATSVRAQSSGGPYRFDKSVIAGGGGVANGGNYRFASTPGQATTARISGASRRPRIQPNKNEPPASSILN